MSCRGPSFQWPLLENVGNQPTDAVGSSTTALHTGRATEHLLLWFEMLAGGKAAHRVLKLLGVRPLLLELLQVRGCAGAREGGRAQLPPTSRHRTQTDKAVWHGESPTLVTIGEPKRIPS